jgi:SAM-dependent methyltransferase
VTSPAAIDADTFRQRAREHYEGHASSFTHHPTEGYDPKFFRHYHRAELLRRVFRALDFHSALDVGCADGYFVDLLRREFGADATGVDLAPSFAERVRSVFGAPSVVGDATALPFRSDSVDLVLCTETVEHVLDVRALVEEMRRVARRWIVVTVPVGADEEPDLDFSGEGHVHDFDRAGLRELFGDDAVIRTTRCNATFGLYAGLGRHLGERAGQRFGRADLAVSALLGSETATLWPLRTRTFVVVASAQG